MRSSWQLQEAKNGLSEVIDRACMEGPQRVMRRGRDIVVIVSCEEYDRLTRPDKGIVELFADSPLAGTDLQIDRDRSPFREPGA
jgi:antitoxin Phd